MLVWDEQGLLSRCGEKPERVKRLINMFLEDLPTAIEGIKNSVTAGDANTLKHQAHTMKGMAANLGALKLQEVMFDLELQAEQAALHQCANLMEQLHNQLKLLTEELEDYMED